MTHIDTLITNSKIFTADASNPVIHDGAIAISDQTIVWVGKTADIPSEFTQSVDRRLTLNSGWLTPGLIDCHTHLIYGGNRSSEFRRQLEGETYEQISASGGGILSTVRDTRCASEQELYDSASARLSHWLHEGVTHIEIKSGYGLDLDNELKMLRVAQRLETEHSIGISKTLLAAHTLAPEFKAQFDDVEQAKDQYIDYICGQILPTAMDKGLVDAVDGFCENIAFNINQIETLFKVSSDYGLPIKLHAEQLSNQQGSKLAASHNALSVDHLEYLDESSIKTMAESKTVAVLLPAAFYYLKETRVPPIDLLRAYNIPMAIATDHNPGSSPVESLTLILNMGCRLFGLTPMESLYGTTINAAKALGLQSSIGSLEAGKQADILHWDITDVEDLCYYFGAHCPDIVIQSGNIIRQPGNLD